MRASNARNARALIESARRSAERIGVAGQVELPTALAGEIIRRARIAAAMHLTAQVETAVAAVRLDSSARPQPAWREAARAPTQLEATS